MIHRLAGVFGPKATAAAAAATTLAAQIESRLATSPIGTGVLELAQQAVHSGDLLALLPAPAAGVLAFLARKSRGDGVLEPVNGESEGKRGSSAVVVAPERALRIPEPVTIPPGRTVDDLSDVEIMPWHEFESYEDYFTYGELLEGHHLGPKPMTEESARELRELVVELESDIESCRGMLSRDIAAQQEKVDAVVETLPDMRKRLNALERSREALEANAFASIEEKLPDLLRRHIGLGAMESVMDRHSQRLDGHQRKLDGLGGVLTALETLLRRVELTEQRVTRMLEEEPPEPSIPDPEPPTVPRRQPRNVRNQNPGNIEKTREGGNRWRGEVEGEDERFATFSTHAYGARAMMYLLRNYERRHGLRSIESIISRWSPVGDPTNPEGSTAAYIRHVSELTGFAPNQGLDLDSKEHLVPLAIAMAHHEGGRPYPNAEEVFAEGYRLLP